MKYLALLALSIIPSLASEQETSAKSKLPPTVQALAESRIKVTVEMDGKTYHLLVPNTNGSNVHKLREAVKRAGLEMADEATTGAARANGGEHYWSSLFSGKFVLVVKK